MTDSQNLSRRSFLTGVTAAGALAMAGGLTACSSGDNNQQDGGTTAPTSVNKTYDTDLVIVGAGGAGLACAVQSALNGTNFIMIEKNTEVGGNASFVEGMFAINSKMQNEKNIHITAAEINEAELVRGQHRQNGALWMDLCQNSAGNIDWCLEQGVMYSGTIDNYYGGLFPTFHWFKDNKSSVGYVEPMTKRIEELGVETHFNTSATSLIMQDGKVAGIYAESGDDGAVQYNTKAVIFATGGFGGSEEMIAKQGWDTTGLHIVGSPNAAGDAYKMAMEAGAKDFMTDTAQSILYSIEALPMIDFHNDSQNPINGYFGIAAGGPVLWVNEYCDRYTRENLTDDNLVLQCIPGKANRDNYVLFDDNILNKFFGANADALGMFEDSLASNEGDSLFKADSIAELAGKFSLDSNALQATLDHYNELCNKGADEDFGKTADKMVAISTAPYYMAKLSYSFFFAVGGITTNRKREVVDNDQNAIPGLYAIGNDGNMQYRNVYTINMPGTAFGHQVNSGRESANNAATYIGG